MLSVLGVALVWTSLSVTIPGPATTMGVRHHTPTSATSGPTTRSTAPLTRGDRGPRVAELQRALIANGITVRGGADGIFGSATSQALTTFQTAQGLRPTGSLDVTTAHLLDLGPAPEFPRRGDRNESVATLQRALLSAGVTVRGGADGVFGRATETAISAFQTTKGLSVTGRVDIRTAIALGIAPQADSTSATQNSATQNSATQNASTPDVVDPQVTPDVPSVSGSTVSLPRRGQTGEQVAVLQRALIAAGVNVRGGADGLFGSATETALKIYQRAVRRPATGALDDITAQLLGLLPAPIVPRRGDRGETVTAIQLALIERGVTVRGGADGVFGAATEKAIATFQAAHGLTASGRLDLVSFFVLTTSDASGTSHSGNNDNSNDTSSTSNSPITATIFPVQGPCWFTDTWLAPRSGGRRHQGVDIIAPSGKAVYAVADGTITRVFLDRPGSLGGNALRLTAADGTYFHYAHFSAFADGIELGSDVVAGQIIGFIGSTGSSSTPHLHFEYHPFGGAAVNPFPVVKKIDACKVVDVLPQPGESVAD